MIAECLLADCNILGDKFKKNAGSHSGVGKCCGTLRCGVWLTL
jgi:hypothetical protein